MTDRDRQLMGMLATVRYLSGEQLGRLLFAERSDINRKKRLAALGGEGKHGLEPAYLKRLSYRSWDGVAQSAWCLTKAGYAVAASVLPEPVSPPLSEPGVTYIEHGLLKESKSSLTARVHTIEGAAEKLLKLLGETPAPAPKRSRTIVSAEVRLIREFHTSTLATMTAVRANAQARGVREPEFPTGTNRMRALLEKLSASR